MIRTVWLNLAVSKEVRTLRPESVTVQNSSCLKGMCVHLHASQIPIKSMTNVEPACNVSIRV